MAAGGTREYPEGHPPDYRRPFARARLMWLPGLARFGSEDEHPLVRRDLDQVRDAFGYLELRLAQLTFARIFDRNVFRQRRPRARRTAGAIDDWLLSHGADRWSYHQVLFVVKPPRAPAHRPRASPGRARRRRTGRGLSCAHAHLGEPLGVGEQVADRGRPDLRALGRQQAAGDAVLHQLGPAAHVGDQQRRSHGHALQHHVGERLVPGGEQRQVERPQQGGHVAAPAEEVDGFAHAQRRPPARAGRAGSPRCRSAPACPRRRSPRPAAGGRRGRRRAARPGPGSPCPGPSRA